MGAIVGAKTVHRTGRIVFFGTSGAGRNRRDAVEFGIVLGKRIVMGITNKTKDNKIHLKRVHKLDVAGILLCFLSPILFSKGNLLVYR